MKKKSIQIFGTIILFTLIIAGCGKAMGTDKDAFKNIVNVYGEKRLQYMDNDDYMKGYKIDSSGTNYAERITYNAKLDGSVISGYTANIRLISENYDIKEEDLIKFAEVEFMQYMDSGSQNIVQTSCIIKTPDKNEHIFTLRFADAERTKVIQYIENGNDDEYKEIDNSYVEKAGKADGSRYFYTRMGNNDFLFKDTESGEASSLNVDIAELVFGKNVDTGDVCDIIMTKTDEHNKEIKESNRDYICNGIVFGIETKGKRSATVAAIYDENGYKIFKFNDGTKETKTLERIEGIYVDRDLLEKELESIL